VVVCALLASCGGGDSPVELSFDSDVPPSTSLATIVLTGRSFVPQGSNCPASSEFVIIGTLGAHTIGYRNETTGISGPVFDQLWVCNSDGGRTMAWRSNPITLQSGANRITVTMNDAVRASSASITIVRQ
jgi:hypothetical protein